ncbi:MAG: fibronectin type III domain-containing protein [Treponema sp.]|jgi:hypothetical protein|nr:fibronectin type III domain-containing protein [Treponema sp.]
MHISKAGKCPAGFKTLLFRMALVSSVLFFFACETGGDPDSSLPLSAPRSVQVTANDKALVLQWTKVSPAQGVIPTYKIYYSKEANSKSAEYWEEIIAGASNLVVSTITNLINRQTYYVWVKAVYNDLGESSFSDTTYGTPIPPPATPVLKPITPGENMLEVTWELDEDAFTYEVRYKAGVSNDAIPPTDAAMKTVSEAGTALIGLDNTTYTIWVRAVNTAGNSPAYAKSSGTPVAASTVPAKAPDKPTVTPGNKKLTLTWNQVDGVPFYKLYYGIADDFSTATEFSAGAATIPANAPKVSADITGLTNKTPYYVWVQSWNSQSTRENSPRSDSASGTPVAKDAINFNNLQFVLGTATAEYIFAQDLPDSPFFPGGNLNTDRLTRVQETTLGDLYTDGAAWYIRNQYPDENIDFVFLNGGYIDNALPKGTVTVGTISSITQPDSRGVDKFMLLTMKGDKLKLFFEDEAGRVEGEGDVAGVVHTGRGGPHNTGYFGIVSKEVRYTLQYYDVPEGTTELSSVEREPYYHGFIKDLTINGVPINDEQYYRICTTDYCAAGDYFFRLYTDGENKRVLNTLFWHGVAEYIYDQGTVTPALDGRIKVEGGVPLPAPWVPSGLGPAPKE